MIPTRLAVLTKLCHHEHLYGRLLEATLQFLDQIRPYGDFVSAVRTVLRGLSSP